MVFGAAVKGYQASVVATDGSVTDGASPVSKERLGGFAVVDVPSHEEAPEWAAKIAVRHLYGRSCRTDHVTGVDVQH